MLQFCMTILFDLVSQGLSLFGIKKPVRSHRQAILGSKTSQGLYPDTHQKALGLVEVGSANHQLEG